MRTFYEILGIKRNASQEEILVAYRKRCLETHPDRGGNETDFLNIRKGYEILSNQSKRIEYDKWVKAKEDIEKKEYYSSIKKRLEPWINSFLNQYCQDDFFKTLILTYFYGTDSIYNNVNRNKLNKVLTAEVVKNILSIIREDNTYKIESVLALDSICNDILLGKKDIKIEVDKKKEESDKKGINGLFVFRLIASIFVGLFIIVICIPIRDNSSKVEKVFPKEEQEPVYTRRGDETIIRNRKNTDVGKVVENANNTVNNVLDKYNISKRYADNDNISGNTKYRETIFKTGDCPYSAYYGYGGDRGQFDKNSLSKLSIQNYSSSEAVVLLENIYGDVIRNVYIKNNSEYTMTNIPEGRYRIKVMYGNSWNEEKDNGHGYPKGGFMKNTSFSKSKDNDLFDYTFERDYKGISYPTYSVTLHKVVNGNMQTERITKDDFF